MKARIAVHSRTNAPTEGTDLQALVPMAGGSLVACHVRAPAS